MPLTKQFFRVNFGQGLDTKSDPKTLSSGKMTVLQNAKFQYNNRISKRDGFTGASGSVGTTPQIQKLLSFNNNVYGIGQNNATTSTRSIYQTTKDTTFGAVSPSFNDCLVTTQNIITNENYQFLGDTASTNGYTIHAWLEVSGTNSPIAYYTISDTVSRTNLCPTYKASKCHFKPTRYPLYSCRENSIC